MSTSSIPFTISQVAGVAIGAIDAEKTLTIGDGGSASVFSGVVVSERGRPFTALKVTKSNFIKLLGAPIHPSKGKSFEPIRHVADAVKGGFGYVVRVVPEDARFPLITLSKPTALKSKSVKSGAGDVEPLAAEAPVSNVVVSNSSQPFEGDVTLSDGQFCSIYVVDGDPSANRVLSIEKDEAEEGRFILKLAEISKMGVSTLLDNITISFDLESVDDMGRPAYIVTALENRSQYLRAVCNSDLALTSGFTSLSKQAFVGGTNGDLNNISIEQYRKATTVLRNAFVDITAVLGLGCYEPSIIAELADIALDRRIDAFFDIAPTLNYAEALTVADELPLHENPNSCVYHFPFSSRDSYSQSTVVYGLSGAAFVAKAKGVAKVPDVGGWHYSPAGQERGVISRIGLAPLPGVGEPDYEMMYAKRINKIENAGDGVLMIDDALTTYRRDNYLRFQHIPSTMNAISRDFYILGRALKHQPDGITIGALERELPRLLDRYIGSGALVKPRDPDVDGESPYIITVEQSDKDLWTVSWSCCVTGSARRIVGMPALIR